MLPAEIFLFEVVKYLPIRDILHLEQTRRELRITTWKELIRRDFSAHGETKRDYLKFYKTDNHELEDVLGQIAGTVIMMIIGWIIVAKI